MPRILEMISEWVERASWVYLMHFALRGEVKKQQKLAAEMADSFPHLDEAEMTSMGFTDLLRRCKNTYLNVPRKHMSPSLIRFLDRNVNYLTPGVIVGLGYLNLIWGFVESVFFVEKHSVTPFFQTFYFLKCFQAISIAKPTHPYSKEQMWRRRFALLSRPCQMVSWPLRNCESPNIVKSYQIFVLYPFHWSLTTRGL